MITPPTRALFAAGVAVLGIWAGGQNRVPAAGGAGVPAWMIVEEIHKRVSFTVTASEGGGNGTLNFNGYANGQMTVTVPAGWMVHIEFLNAGAGALPHSLEVIRKGKIPPQGVAPAIGGAESRNLLDGVPPQQRDAFDFIAAPAGNYLWFCGVPRHGVSGMWDGLVVSAGARTPAVIVK